MGKHSDPHAGVRGTRFRPTRFRQNQNLLSVARRRSLRKRQTEFFFGHLAARQALAAIEAGIASADIGIGAAREPLSPAGVISSITHDRRLTARAVEIGDNDAGSGSTLSASSTWKHRPRCSTRQSTHRTCWFCTPKEMRGHSMYFSR
jgi:hypothetical protein